MNKTYHIQFYTKEGCHLCNDVKELLHRLGNRFPLIVHEVDITADAALYEQYKAIIPVVIIDGQFTLKTKIDEEDICRYLWEGS